MHHNRLWVYTFCPLFTLPGFRCTEIEPWHKTGEVWRRLRVVIPDYIATHTKEQISQFGRTSWVYGRHHGTGDGYQMQAPLRRVENGASRSSVFRAGARVGIVRTGFLRCDIFLSSRRFTVDVPPEPIDCANTLSVAGVAVSSSRLIMLLGPSVTWGSEKYLQLRFGVTPSESVLSTHPVYRPTAGVSASGIGYSATFFMTSHWLVQLDAAWRWLLNSAQDSPITERGSSPAAAFSVSYRW
jgi:hypothetical protein